MGNAIKIKWGILAVTVFLIFACIIKPEIPYTNQTRSYIQKERGAAGDSKAPPRGDSRETWKPQVLSPPPSEGYERIGFFTTKDEILKFIDERQLAVEDKQASAQQSFNSRLAYELAQKLPEDILTEVMFDPTFCQAIENLSTRDDVDLYERILQVGFARLNLDELPTAKNSFSQGQNLTWERITTRIEFEHDPESIFEVLATRPLEAIPNLEPVAIEVSADKQPKQALTYFLSGKCNSTSLTPKARELIGIWVADNPDKASVMLNASTNPVAKDVGISVLVETLASTDSYSARVWAATISDEKLREEALKVIDSR